MKKTIDILRDAVRARVDMNNITSSQINSALRHIAALLLEKSSVDMILTANKSDVEQARGISQVMIDRLSLDEAKIRSMAKGIIEISNLPSPLGETISSHIRDDGLEIKKVRIPLGVVAIIYESRPNVTTDAFALSFKSGNVCILRSGKEAHNTSSALVQIIKRGLSEQGISGDVVSLVEDTSRQSALELMRANGFVDLLIPRGGHALIKSCVENATVHCIQTGTGICHIYVDKSADIEKALNIVENAKTSRPSVCNAAEVCLVHGEIANEFLPLLKQRLVDERIKNGKTPVELRCDAGAFEIIGGTPCSENDFDTEFLDYILAIGVVDSVDEAILHIGLHSTGHSEAIVSRDSHAIEKFTRAIDSAALYVNASTRFTDGGEFGLGCEMGISTQKLHARGPMGILELTSYKYIVCGDGHVR